jgi:hypothetical protein
VSFPPSSHSGGAEVAEAWAFGYRMDDFIAEDYILWSPNRKAILPEFF